MLHSIILGTLQSLISMDNPHKRGAIWLYLIMDYVKY